MAGLIAGPAGSSAPLRLALLPRLPRLALLTGCVLASGCAVHSTRLAQQEYSDTNERTGGFQAQAREPQRLPALVQADTVPRFARHSIPLQRAAALPTHIGQVTLRYPGRHPLTTVAELISRLIDIPVIMTPDALVSAADYAPGGMLGNEAGGTAPGGAGGSTSAAASHAALAEQAVAAGAQTLSLQPRELQNTMELDYSGPLSGLLNQVATRAGLQWEYNGGKIVFSRLVTRSILVKALPNGLKTNGSFDVFGGNSASATGGGSGGGSGASSSGASGNTGTLTVDFETDSDYWAGLRDSLKGMLSARAHLQVDPRSGLVTVTDALNNVERVEAFLHEVNTSLLRQVVLEVEVLQVNLNDQYSNGINWEAVLGKAAGNQWQFTGPKGPGALSGGSPSLSFTLAPSSSRFKASTLVANSLQEYGKVATAYSSVVTTTNRMPVPVGSLQTQSYVRQTTATVVNGTNGVATGSSLVPGSISTGLGLMILPVILDSNRILLQTVMQVSELREIKAFTSGDGPTAQSIQLPNTVSFSSLQRISVPAGDTLVLVGYEREQTQADDTDVVRGLLPVAKRGGRSKQGTVILITPRLTDR